MPSVRPRRFPLPLLLSGLAIMLLFLVAASAARGAVSIPISECLRILWHRAGFPVTASIDRQHEAVLLLIRLPRVLLALLVGAGLGISGTAMQGLMRNPLADPSLIGISSGGALAATLVFLAGDVAGGVASMKLVQYPGIFLLPAAAFLGALATTLAVYRLSHAAGRMMIAVVLLAGIAINAIANAFSALLTFFATDTQIRNVSFWKLGSLGGATWMSVAILLPCVLLPVIVLTGQGRVLNAFLLGEGEAFHLGLRVERAKRTIILMVALAAGASVAFTGIIGFVGLVVPHILRFVTGPDYRRLLPASALFGAALLLACDLVSRTLVVPAELPIGIITALGGAPFFLYLLLRNRKLRFMP